MEQILLYIRIGLFLSEEKSMRHSHALAGAVKMQDIWSRFLSEDCSPPGHMASISLESSLAADSVSISVLRLGVYNYIG